MVNRVPEDEIEELVGALRHGTRHLARADSAAQIVYLLHPHNCRRKHGLDLRYCPYSLALDLGIPDVGWRGHLDRPVVVAMQWGRLLPVRDA